MPALSVGGPRLGIEEALHGDAVDHRDQMLGDEVGILRGRQVAEVGYRPKTLHDHGPELAVGGALLGGQAFVTGGMGTERGGDEPVQAGLVVEHHRPFQRLAQTLPRIEVFVPPVASPALTQRRAQRGDQHLALVGEVVRERSGADAGFGRHLAHRRAFETPAGDEAPGSCGDEVATGVGVDDSWHRATVVRSLYNNRSSTCLRSATSAGQRREAELHRRFDMVYRATRGDVPVRIGPTVQQIPSYGASQVDREVYRDPVRFELERERVLGQSWLLAGRSADVAEPGDWLTYEGHGELVVVTRQRDGGLAAFHNVCQHRGPAIVGPTTGCGAKRFTCPYHGWVYDTTGQVVGVPEREDFDPAHLDGMRAPAVAVDEWGGWIWVNLAGPGRAEPLGDWLGTDVSDDLGRFRMQDMVLLDKLEWDVDVNYKAIVDGFNEVYHITQLHHVPAAATKAARDTSFHLAGRNSMMFVPRAPTMDQLWDTLDHHRYTICHYVVFPNTVFNCNPEHIQVFNPVPIDVDRTKFICWQLVYPGDRDDPEYAAYYDDMTAHWKVLQDVVAEDVMIYEQLARTKRSSGYVRNTLSERECKIGKYHDTMNEMIATPPH